MTQPMQAPVLKDVYAARARVYPTVRPTPLMYHPLLGAEMGLSIYVKHENHNPTGAFKIRGGLNLIGSLSAEERRGVGQIHFGEVQPAAGISPARLFELPGNLFDGRGGKVVSEPEQDDGRDDGRGV